ncbi:MAG: hypothetical protein AB1512_19970 [Thermodesulfobacteriota bacterium]
MRDSLRRNPGRALRVLHCPLVALYQPALLVDGLRRHGLEADSMIFDFGEDRWLSLGVDINLGLDRCNSWQRLFRIQLFLFHAAKHYDIFHFHSGRTLLPLWVDSRWSPVPEPLRPFLSWMRAADFADLRLLKRLGKKLVFSFWGCDIRKPTELSENPDYLCHHCLPGERQCQTPFRKNLVRSLVRFGDAVILSGDIIRSWPDARWVPNALDLRVWNPTKVAAEVPDRYRVKKNGKLLLLHAFANSDKRGDHKGSGRIRETVQNLIQEGLPLQFLSVDGVPVEDMKYIQVQADLVIDQFRLGCYGSFGLESMALGRPVVGWINPDLYREQPEMPPMVTTDLRSLGATLRDLVSNPSRMEEIGRACRGYVEKVHDHVKVAGTIERIYRNLYAH